MAAVRHAVDAVIQDRAMCAAPTDQKRGDANCAEQIDQLPLKASSRTHQAPGVTDHNAHDHVKTPVCRSPHRPSPQHYIGPVCPLLFPLQYSVYDGEWAITGLNAGMGIRGLQVISNSLHFFVRLPTYIFLLASTRVHFSMYS